MDDIEIEVTARTDIVGSEVTTTVSFDREEWEQMDDFQRGNAVFEVVTLELIEWDYEVVG